MSRYAGKIKVIGVDKLCFPADPVTLEPLGCGCYDPYPWQSGEGAAKMMGVDEWSARKADMRDAEFWRWAREESA